MPEQRGKARSEEDEARNRSKDEEHGIPTSRRSALRALVQDFGPLWFTWCMNAGIISILTHQSPYQFKGLHIISTIFFVLDLALFVVFSVLFIARFVCFGREAYQEIVGNMVDLTLVACWSISWLTLTSLVCLVASQAAWGGYAFTIVGYVMWWIGAAWNLIILLWVFITLIRRHDASDRRLPTTIFLPAVSVSTVAVTGGLVATQAHAISARLAIPLVITSFLYLGVGIFFGLILTTYLLHALLAEGWPPPQQIATVFILIGPYGQSSAAIQLLGSFASHGGFADYNKGTFLTAEQAPALEAACTMLALLMTGLGVIWLLLSLYSMIECAVDRKLVWAPNWNSIIFPTGTLASSTLQSSIEMDSPAFRVISAALIIFLVFFFVLNLAFTVARIWQGKLLVVREDPRVKEKLETRQKER